MRRWRRHLAEERMEAETYRRLARRRSGEDREVLLELADAEGRHEAHWLHLLGRHSEPAPRPSLSARMHSHLASVFGTVFVLAMAQRAEQRTTYDHDRDATAQMAADEHIHGEVIRGLTARSRQSLAGSFRAAVFGANDGLVSNLALVLGVAATGMSAPLVLATGVAGLLAGAMSMAAGEWVSVSSQRELLDASVPDPRAHLSVPALDVDANELALVFRARGEAEEAARAHAAAVFAQVRRPPAEESGSVAVRAALGGTQATAHGAGQEIGTPLRAALSSFGFFSLGAVVPLLPFILGLTGTQAIAAAAAVVGLALLATGGVVGVLSGQAPWPRALRQMAIGYGAAGITYLLGLLFGTTLG
ncbi:MAG: VIT1/CCC1 family protein [Propionibacterium sp.]|nr:VIT1/CCC1 family protein [Propionibacterium sp.]